MYHLRALSLVVLLAAFLFGCQEGPSALDEPSQLTVENTSGRFDFTNGPANPGESGVFRFQDTFVFGSTSQDGLLQSFITSDSGLSILGCGALGQPFALNVQSLRDPDFLQTLAKTQEAWVAIIDISGGEPPPFCGSPIVAEGVGKVVFTVNANNASEGQATFGFRSQGTLPLTAGGCASYHITSRAVLANGVELFFDKGDVRLHPVPDNQC